MKITQEHYQYVKRAIQNVDAARDLADRAARYRHEGLSPKRFRWDCTYGAGLSKWVCENVYPYADDAHIDTMLRAIMRELQIPWAAQS